MKKTLLSAAVAGLLLAGCGNGDADTQTDIDLESEDARVGYSMGMTFAKRVEQDLPDLDSEAFLAGIQDGIRGEESRLSDEEIQETLMEFQRRMQEEQMQGQQQQDQGGNDEAAANRERSEEFLAENAERDEVTVTDSGLQYEVLEEGDGESPSANSRVTVHYTGTLIDGEVFDSSRERGEPVTFGLQQVIPGWTEGLQLMEEGGRYKLYIPSDLGYGPGGTQGIGPNQALIFDVELISID